MQLVPVLGLLGILVLAAATAADSGSRSRSREVQDLESQLDQVPYQAFYEDDEGTYFQIYGDDGRMIRASSPAYQTFLRMEPSSVPDDLLVAVLLAGATQRSPVEVARELLREANGDLARVAMPSHFQAVPGVGDSGYARLMAADELARRIAYLRAMANQNPIRNPDDAVRVLQTMSVGPEERLTALYVDRRNRVIGTRILSVGSDAFTIVDPRVVFRPAIELRARGVILAHQHPSGDARPSRQDIEVTNRLQRAALVLGVDFLDHIVIGHGGRYNSMVELGHMVPSSSNERFTTY
jgi:DNA repair protein RadC